MNDNESESSVLDSAPEVVQMGALESIERAQIDMQIATAKRYPRTMSKVKSDMLSLACLDDETAAACFYTLPRGGKSIQGPSVRLAEIALSSFGNARAATRVISEVTDGQNPHVMIQAVCFDLEKNVAVSIEKRRRITKKKSKERIDEDDINLAVNACAAIAFRDAVFKIVPGALVKPVMDQCKKTAVGDVKSLVAKRSKTLERLKLMGLTEDRILLAVDCKKVEDIDLDKLEILLGLGTSIKDGHASLEEAFPFAPHPGLTPKPAETAGAATTATATTSPKLEEKKPDPKPEPKKEPPVTPTNVVPMVTPAATGALTVEDQEAKDEREAQEEQARIAAEKAKAKAEADAQDKLKKDMAAKAAPTPAALRATFDPAVHLPQLKNAIDGFGITVGQLSAWMYKQLGVPPFTTLEQLSKEAPRRIVMLLQSDKTGFANPKVVAEMKAFPTS